MKLAFLFMLISLFTLKGYAKSEECMGEQKIIPCTRECMGEQKIIPCTREYKPVCGCDEITYSNACVAESAGVLKWSDGACKD